jgi:uncharacterized protein YkuJ
MIIKPKKCKVCKEPFTPKRSTLENTCSVICAIEYGKSKPIKLENKEQKEATKAMRIDVKSNEYRKELQRNINILSRMIDKKFGFDTCIDCGKPFGNQIDAAHYHDMSTNRGIRFHLDNLHSSRSNCNQYSSSHKVGYTEGLKMRYGQEYYEKVENLQYQYKDVKLSSIEIFEKLTLVKKLIRIFDTFQFENSLVARTQFNKIIAIYS